MRRETLRLRGLVVVLAAVGLSGCGGYAANRALDRSYVPLIVGRGPGYRPGPGLAGGGRVGRLVCSQPAGVRRGVHLELFANRHVIVLPAGIGVLGGRRDGPYVRGGRCFYPLLTREPTGVVEIAAYEGALRLGDLFALWGQPLSRTALVGFSGTPVQAYVDGRRVTGDPRMIALRPHSEIVLEIAGYVAPHRSYRFPGDL